MLGSYFEPGKSIKSITSYLMTAAVRTAVKTSELDKMGRSPKAVASHSLRSEGAMAMHLAKVPDTAIKKMGRWSTDTFLMYILEQILAFLRGISNIISKHVQF